MANPPGADYDAALRRRLSIINGIGDTATQAAQSMHTVPWADNPVRSAYPNTVSAQPMGSPTLGGYVNSPSGRVFQYNGPRHNEAALVNFGRLLQQMGFKVSENSHFGGVTQGAHVKNSKHYLDEAIDVNWAPGTSRAEQRKLAGIVPLARYYGLSDIFMQPGHYNHAHFDF